MFFTGMKLRKDNPLNQGLKHDSIAGSFVYIRWLRKDNPLNQGLKLEAEIIQKVAERYWEKIIH